MWGVHTLTRDASHNQWNLPKRNGLLSSADGARDFKFLTSDYNLIIWLKLNKKKNLKLLSYYSQKQSLKIDNY